MRLNIPSLAATVRSTANLGGSLLLAGFLVCGFSSQLMAAEDTLLADNSENATEAVTADTTPLSDDGRIIAFINEQIRQGWADYEYRPSKEADEGKWVRRVYLDLLGRIPSTTEVKDFLSDRSKEKKEALVDKLLFSEKYEEEFARNWTTVWTNLLIGRNGGNDDDRPVNRSGLQQYLRRSLLQNKPYDELAYELVEARGNNTPGEKDYNGAVNFLLDNLQDEQVPATNKVSQIFLGQRVGCTQCHNHPFNSWKQDAFWSFNAFFKQTVALRTFEGNDVVMASLQDQDFAGESGNPEEAEIYYELRNGLLKVAYPRFVDGTRINNSGYVEDVRRREALAQLIRQSSFLPEAYVNRTWGYFFGYGFTKPVDDMGPHNPPSHPELLEFLGTEFANYGYDMRRLMKWITLSEAYSLSSRITTGNSKDDPLKGSTPMFTHFYLRQMQAEQLYESLMIASKADQTSSTYAEAEQTKNRWLQQFVLNFGTDENDEATTFDGTIPQALMLMNSDLIKQATSVDPGSFLHTVGSSEDRFQTMVNELYLAALARRPTGKESDYASKLLAARSGNMAEALQDTWWALLNSNEFILIH
ncbi:Secreted protein containing DUF1549 [Planctomycetales bacterium 10988]|nr:Secreted protein containing DUF1549 [Planctomycetales bacterium 10988]